MGLEITLPTQILPTVQSVDALLRTIAQTLLGDIRERIHEEGLNAKGAAIGQYTANYIKRRIKAGKGSSSKVVLSFTRQMQNDWKVIPIQNGYGLGFSNSFNADKAGWAEERFGAIYKLTPEETKIMQLIINDWLDKNI